MARLLRKREIFARLACGRTKGHEDFIYHPGGPETVPDTDIPRLKLIHIGPRAVRGTEDEVDRLIEALRRHRDAHPASPGHSGRRTSTETSTEAVPSGIKRRRLQSSARRGR